MSGWAQVRDAARVYVLPLVVVGDYTLLPDTAGQQIQIWIHGGQAVEGMDFYLQIGDGGAGDGLGAGANRTCGGRHPRGEARAVDDGDHPDRHTRNHGHSRFCHCRSHFDVRLKMSHEKLVADLQQKGEQKIQELWNKNTKQLKAQQKTIEQALGETGTRLVGVEAAGEGLDGRHAAALSGVHAGVLHGSRSYLLQDDDGQITEEEWEQLREELREVRRAGRPATDA